MAPATLGSDGPEADPGLAGFGSGARSGPQPLSMGGRVAVFDIVSKTSAMLCRLH